MPRKLFRPQPNQELSAALLLSDVDFVASVIAFELSYKVSFTIFACLYTNVSFETYLHCELERRRNEVKWHTPFQTRVSK